MVNTREELLKLVLKYNISNLPRFRIKNTLFWCFSNDKFYYDRGHNNSRIDLTDQEAIDLYNKLQFEKEFLDKL